MTRPYAPPREAGVGNERPDRRRLTPFLRIYIVTLLISAALVACWATLQLMSTAGPNLQAVASQFVFHDGLRKTAPIANAVAQVLALVLWATRQRPERVRRRLRRVLRHTLVGALPGYLVGSVVAVVTGLAALLGPFAQPMTIVPVGARIVTLRDFWIGAQSAVLGTLLVVGLAHFCLARWVSLNLALPLKLLGALSLVAAAHLWLSSLLS